MNYKRIGRYISPIMALEALFMLPALVICLFEHDFVTALAFLYSIIAALIISGILYLLTKKSYGGFYAREGLVCVGLSWILMSLVGCLPFYLSHQIPNYVDALFEIVSGFTTTGSSILTNVEALTKGALYWRSFSHWLGGMGVLVFLLALVPATGRSDGFTMHLLRAESPGPDVGKLVPRMKKTASILYLLYIVLTVIDFVFLIAGKMPVFDAVCTAFGTAGTGGFGIKLDSMAGYSPYLQNVTTVFMLLFGVNFSCYYLLIIGSFKSVFKDEELRFYLLMVLGSITLITLNIRDLYPTISEAIRHAAFQVSSIVTTTGFATTDFDLWPSFSKAILLILMLMGACAGSTGGGFKCSRVIILLKTLRRNIRQVLHPNDVEVIKINDRPVSEKVLSNTSSYLAVYMFIMIGSFLLISLNGFSFTTNISAVAACFNNIGPGFDMVGPCGSFANFNAFSKIILTLDMLAGRLEIFPILVLFSKDIWKKW